MSVLVLLLGAGGGRDAAAGPEVPEDVPAFTYEQYCDAQGHFTYDGAALKLVKRPAHLARVYRDAAREDARAKVLVGELEHWFHQAGLIVADTTTRPACLPLPVMTPECQPNWQFLTEFLGDTPEASRLRQVVAHAYEARARERRLQNNVIVAGVNLLLAGGMAKGVMNQAAIAEARGTAGQALAAEAKAAQAEARAAGQGRIAAEAGPKLLNPPINITPKGLEHVIERHTYSGIAKYAGKSKFNAGEDVVELIRSGTQQPMVQQANGNFARTFDVGRTIGVDRTTNQATSVMTILTKPDGTLVTAFPGAP